MLSQVSEQSLPYEIQRQIDACCLDFEQAWKEGGTPRLEEYLGRIAAGGRTQLLCELMILELNYRRDESGLPLSDERFCALHPELMPEIADQLKLLRERKWGLPGEREVTQRMSASASEIEPTIAHEHRSSSGSRGLHIRCPHCSNPVELLADTPLESITCRTCGSAFSLVDNEDHTREAPTLKCIGRFELVSRLGMGGFGTVWKARDTELDRTVAIKIPRKGQLAREEVEQFLREARSAAQLRHPNIVTVHEVGRDGDTIFIVSDLIRGVSLSDWLTGGTHHPGEIARLMATVTDAVQHAHEKGIIHRDLKPSNILMDEFGQPHVMDFGLAKREIGEITMTVDGQVLGTPAYMSPEQAGGESHYTDRRTDIYSLGIVLFRMLAGELPFRGNAQMQIHQRLTEDPPDPRALNSHLPRDLCTICVKCMERDPNRRFATAKDLGDELCRFVRKEPILSRPISRVERALRWAKRNPAPTAAGALTVFLAIAGPIAAFLIAAQRNRLSELVVEKDNLIQQYATNKENDANQLATLRDELDLWEGRANPWKIWPPKPAIGPRKLLAQQAVTQATSLAAPWRESSDVREVGLGNLALAIIHDEAERPDEAAKYYQAARESLTRLAAQNPEAIEYAIALADCNRQLSRIQARTNRDAAIKDLESSRTMSHRLANDRKDSRIQAAWLETELESAIMQGFDDGTRHLMYAEQISQNFTKRLPKNPTELYELACYLAEREPMLLTRAEKRDGG